MLAPSLMTTACHELIVQSVDLARLIERHIILMQGSQLMFGWLVVAAIVNRPWSPAKWRGAPCAWCVEGRSPAKWRDALCAGCVERSRCRGVGFMCKHV